jgi:quercetin dioxygenase-like cupin family protein
MAVAGPRESAAGAAAVPIEAAAWKPVFPDQPSGPAMAVLWGDAKKGPVGFLVRFPAGAVVPTHVHSSDYQGVVISGEFSHAAGSEPVVPLAPGSYWSQRGRLPHVNRCSDAGPCVVYLTAPKGFDLTFVK